MVVTALNWGKLVLEKAMLNLGLLVLNSPVRGKEMGQRVVIIHEVSVLARCQ